MVTAVEALLHFTDDPDWTLDRDSTYVQGEAMKPSGIWLSVGGEWRSWCHENDFGVPTVEHAYEVTLTAEANILHLANEEDVVSFAQLYPASDERFRSYSINWPAVARKYDGILISPYQWNCRLHFIWYYGWDVASACVWNLDAIASVQRVDVDAEVRP